MLAAVVIALMTTMLLATTTSVRTKFILTQTSHPGNVGAAARAMKTMGFGELVLVSPQDPKVLNRKRTKEGASGAVDVLTGALVLNSLEEALEGSEIRCATGMPTDMSRERQHQTYNEPRPYFRSLVHSREENPSFSIAFVFGNERNGLRSEDFDLCHVVLGIPANPSFGSLNLASAVQLIAYDWRQALGGFHPGSQNVEV